MATRNGIIGDDAGYGLDIPETETDDSAFKELQKAAKFSRTAEFKALKEHLESRITFYQTYLPNGEQVLNKTKRDLDGMWIVANAIVGELKAVLNAYEQANTTVQEEIVRRKAASRV